MSKQQHAASPMQNIDTTRMPEGKTALVDSRRAGNGTMLLFCYWVKVCIWGAFAHLKLQVLQKPHVQHL